MNATNKERYNVYGPNLGAELHTLEEACEKQKTEPHKEQPDPPVLYAPQSGQAPPSKHPCFEGKPVLPGETVRMPVRFGQTNVPSDPISRPPTKPEETAFAEIWKALDSQEAEFKRWGFPGVLKVTDPPPPGVFTFEEALSQVWCRYTNARWFDAFINRCGYPESMRKLGLITQVGYRIIVAKEKDKRRADNTKRQSALRNGSQSQSANKTLLRQAPCK
jgi:hypothetical protein